MGFTNNYAQKALIYILIKLALFSLNRQRHIEGIAKIIKVVKYLVSICSRK